MLIGTLIAQVTRMGTESSRGHRHGSKHQTEDEADLDSHFGSFAKALRRSLLAFFIASEQKRLFLKSCYDFGQAKQNIGFEVRL